MAPTPAPYTGLLGKPRIFVLSRGYWFNLPFQLGKDPEVLDPRIATNRAESGGAEVVSSQALESIDLIMEAMDAKTLAAWKLLWDQSLQQGEKIELIGDDGRYFWLAGDSIRDIQAGQFPLGLPGYTITTKAGVQGQGAISVDLGDPGAATRTNLIPNGDCGDGDLGGTVSGWVIDTEDTLGFINSAFMAPGGDLSRCGEFVYLGAGEKKAHIDFNCAGLDVASFISDSGFLSLLTRSDWAPTLTGPAEVLSLKLICIDTEEEIELLTTMPGFNWNRSGVIADMTEFTGTSDQLRLEATLSDDLKIAPVYVAEMQLEPRPFSTGFIPYSVERVTLTGSRESAQTVRFLNGLLYRHQMVSWSENTRFGYTIGFFIEPKFNSDQVGTATLQLWIDGDSTDIDTVPAMDIKLTSAGILTCTATLSNFDTVSVSFDCGDLAYRERRHGAVSFIDSDDEDPGAINLYVDGALEDTDSHEQKSARFGKYFWISSLPDGTHNSSCDLSDIAVQPRYIDGNRVKISDFYYSAAAPLRPDRNSRRCILDESQRGRSDTEVGNAVPLQCKLLEVI